MHQRGAEGDEFGSRGERIANFDKLLRFPIQCKGLLHLMARVARSWRSHGIFHISKPQSEVLLKRQGDNIHFPAKGRWSAGARAPRW